MHTRKWFSNVPDVFKCIQQADCVTEVDLDRTKMQNKNARHAEKFQLTFEMISRVFAAQ